MPETLENQQEEPESEVIDLNRPDFSFVPGRHIYRQEGPYIVCRACELHHATYIGIDRLMVGEDENGKPILKSKREVFGK